jgi:mycofactocin biosynthetic radical S-adenosylmethionine protein MftC
MKYSDWPLSAPVNITWEITHQCNLRCIHCLSASNKASPGELTFDECKQIVDELARLKVFEINFGGGEPLLKDYFLPLLRYIHTKGIVTCISTNGTCLTKEAVALFTGNRLVNIQVSLDGATAKVNDGIRGEGTFRNIISGIELLSGKNIPLSINTVLTSQNFTQLNELKALAKQYGARLRVSRFRPSGRARQSWDALRLNPAQLKEIAAWLESDLSILTGDSFFSISQDGRRKMGLDMCGACKLTACIDPVGNVYPCAFLQDEPFCGGNLRDKPNCHSRENGNPGGRFKEIWDTATSFLRLRSLEPSACLACPRFESCRGGCPAVAYFLTKDLNQADPECLVNWSREAE